MFWFQMDQTVSKPDVSKLSGLQSVREIVGPLSSILAVNQEAPQRVMDDFLEKTFTGFAHNSKDNWVKDCCGT